MALNVDSVFRVGLHPTNNIVNALLNDGWRFLEAAANTTPPPTNPLPNTLETITYEFDAAWNFPANPVRESNQMNAVNQAFTTWSDVANINFQLGPASEIVLHLPLMANILNFGGYSGTAGEATQATTAGTGTGVFVVADHGRVHTYIASDGFYRGTTMNPELIFDPTTGAVSPGGMQLIIHEIGHALGLKHTHDDGADGTPDLPDTNIFLPGVPENAANNAGPPNNLNVTVNSIMSYNNAMTTLAGPINNIAVVSTPMAFDIAAVQYLYGANTSSHTGDDTYVLTDTSWSCIWDCSGTDEIVYNGNVDAVINLNPATLDNTPTGGGSVSYLKSTTTTGPTGNTNWATGGFTIAGDVTNALPDKTGITGVIIENALGGNGNDEITGNAADNFLEGRIGNDILTGLAGADTYGYRIGDGTDTIKDFKVAEGDKIDLTGTTFSNFLGLQTLITQDGPNTKITLGDGGLVLENVVATSLTEDQFVLPPDTAPVIVSGAGGDTATYFVRVNDKAITRLAATDVNLGDVISFSIVGGGDADRFGIDNGVLFFNSHPNPPNKSYVVQIQASDGQGGVDSQEITVNVTANKMNGDAAQSVPETFVFHPKFGANTISNFDLAQDFLQFDKGMFSADTAAAVLAASNDTQQGNLKIDIHAGHLTIVGVAKADLLAHASDILFV